MEFSSVFRAANGSVPSPNGTLIASIVPPKLVVRSASTLHVQRVINLNPRFAANVKFMKWSPVPSNDVISAAWNGFWCKRRSGIDNSEEEGTITQRVLLADSDIIQVFDVKDEKWTATISQGFGGIKNVEFGRNADEVVVFSEFQLKVTVWNLITSKHVEISHPKFSNKGYGYRPFTSHFAILTRSGTHDVVSIHQNTTYRVCSTFTLPTIDAQGLKWSPCGRWLAVWDSPTVGYRVLVYTADGHLYRTHEKPCEGLGVKTVEWSPSGDFLTIGSYDGKMCFLSNYTFSPVISMNHTRTIRLPGVTVWSECANSAGKRYYDKVQQPTTLPTLQFNPADPTPKTGISAMAFSNPDGTLVATKNDNMPSSLWIWSIKLLRPYAVLVHLNPIKSFTWHPSIPDLLMIQCENAGDDSVDSSGVVYLWSSTWKEPRTIQVPMEKITGSNWAKWVVTPRPSRSNNSSVASSSPQPYNGRIDRSHSPGDEVDKRPMILFGDREGFIVGYVEDEQVQEDVMEQDDMENRGWANSNIDWDYYSPSRDIPKRSLSSASQSSNLSIPGARLFDVNKSRGGLGAVSEPARNSSPMQQDADDTFDYRVRRKHSVSVRT
ncbi:hypothetical protein BZA05DRAFT_161638 [Tricharina praecox]|uniref:uncharacterized protein n=1 Tax=Tricharina praecox TaxID=43433 RepID=UPI002220FD01|nr:uncharacterized protein BZA05DRAFT_161638 [Tricharina praecox]KAI5856912.1 hypothetical protein BZA05DRAFT_161638 [Tricharina praecox]